MNLYKKKEDEKSKTMFVIQQLEETDIRKWLSLHEHMPHGMIIISGFSTGPGIQRWQCWVLFISSLEVSDFFF